MTKTKWIVVITVTFLFITLCAFGIKWLQNSNERLNELRKNSFYNDELTVTEITQSNDLSETTFETEQTATVIPETTAAETEPPDKADETAEYEETDMEITTPPIFLETSAETEETDLPGWQDYDENGELLQPYSLPETTTTQTFENEILIIPLEGA